MKKHRSGAFLTRCVMLTVLLAALSVLLASAACYYSMQKEEQRQEDASMRIATSTARQRMDDFLSRYQILLDRIMTSASYQRLQKQNADSFYESTRAARTFGNEMEPYLSKLKGGELFLVFLPDSTSIVRLELNDTVIHSADALLERLQTQYDAAGPETAASMCLQSVDYGGKSHMAICAMRYSGQEKLYFALTLNDDFWSSLTDGDFDVYLSNAEGEIFSQRQTLPDGDSYCSEPLSISEWTLTTVYSYHSSLRFLQDPLGLGLLLTWLGLSGGVSFLLMRRRISEINAISSAIEARLRGKTILIQEPPAARRLRLSMALVLLLSLTAGLSVAGSAVFLYGRCAPANRQQIYQYYQRAAQQISSYLDGVLSSYRQALENIAVREDVQQLFRTSDNADHSAELWQLQQTLGFVPPEYGNLTLYSMDGSLLASTVYNAEYLKTKPSYHTPSWDNMLQQRQLWQYRQGEWGSIRLGILVAGVSPSLPGYGEKLGTIWLDFDDTGVKQIVNDLVGDTSRCALYDRDGTLLLWTDGFAAPLTLDELPEEGRFFCVENASIPANGWVVRLFVDETVFFNQMQRVWLMAGVMLLVILLGLFCICIAIERDLLYAIRALAGVMRAVQADHTVRYKEEERHPDEIRNLGRQFNRMINQLDEAANRSVVMERKLREFEINMLQSQINPHFLYNTLRTVQVLIFRQDPAAIAVIDKLITFFRSASNVQVKVVSLRQEMAQVEAYVSIQTLRFGNRFTVVYDLPESLLDAKILHFCLQPLVENAISHGMATVEKDGVITIRAEVADSELLLCVQDSGAGMSPESLEALRRKLNNVEYDSHIGVLNVHQRIQLTFGQRYGITVTPNQPTGICIQMNFPYESQK